MNRLINRLAWAVLIGAGIYALAAFARGFVVGFDGRTIAYTVLALGCVGVVCLGWLTWELYRAPVIDESDDPDPWSVERADGKPLDIDDALVVAEVVRLRFHPAVAARIVESVAAEVARREAAPLVVDSEWRALGGAA